MKALSYFEADVDYCSRTYGVAPCAAAIGVTGTRKCTNTRATCQDIANYQDIGATIRFAENSAHLPRDIDCVPNIKSIKFTPGTVSLGEDLGSRSTLEIEFSDHRHPDTGIGFDKYVAERPFNPFKQGSFWGKFRARHPFLQDRTCRLVRGLLGQTLAGMDTRHYLIESTDGPDPDGVYKIISKDILKLADGDKAQAPTVSSGRLAADITNVATFMSVVPLGAGDDYPPSGFLNLGGKEIVGFTRLPDATLLVHLDGANGSFVFTDVAGNHPIVRVGNVTISTAQGVFGQSAVFDGVDDQLQVNLTGSTDFAFALGPYTIDQRVRFTGNTLSRTLIDFRFNLTDLAPTMFTDATGHLCFGVGNTTLITGTTVLVINQWYHVAVTRDGGGNTRLFLDGVQQGATYNAVFHNLIIGGTSPRPVWGTRSDGAQDFAGFMDELRIVKGRANWIANFTPDTQPYGTDLGDNFNITRAQMGTEASAHPADERVQWVLQLNAMDPADIINYLLVGPAAVPPSYIPLPSWQAETSAFLGNVYTCNIAEPTSVNKLLSELVEQAALALWWDDAARLIRLQVLRQIPLNATKVTADDRVANSLKITEQPDKRISRVLTYFGQINPLKELDQLENYQSSLLTIDATAEADYESPSLKKIFSRWIPFGGTSVATRLNNAQLSRYRNAPRKVSYTLMRYGNTLVPSLGAGYNLQADCFQDDIGNLVDMPVEVVRLNADDAVIEVEAEEMRFTGAQANPNDHTIIIDVNVLNVNLRTLHDSLYGPPVAGNIVTVQIQAGVKVGSNVLGGPAMDVGTWPVGIPVTIKGTGRIQGRGGNGGSLTAFPQAGGTALKTTRAISIDMLGGMIWGGGGGGGSGSNTVTDFVGAGGSGGAGQTPGLGGPSDVGFPGNPGTTEQGGAAVAPGGNVFTGGAGGNPGQAGSVGQGVGGQAGGAGGTSIDGLSFVTMVNAPNVQGATIP